MKQTPRTRVQYLRSLGHEKNSFLFVKHLKAEFYHACTANSSIPRILFVIKPKLMCIHLSDSFIYIFFRFLKKKKKKKKKNTHTHTKELTIILQDMEQINIILISFSNVYMR